ncbi:hypothetical protein GpartN1_g4341.t1 [Galdieria partita]|uniref:Uncharacterized protein n=1 Tax=Galdieria partita TaxID=83374 RepID=A0A9C7URE7_9RHOD|nr:hypothetical protein GpartN1_g4341.t1 [Galdieria partita]
MNWFSSVLISSFLLCFFIYRVEAKPNLRVAALGDSVASGEGTLYGLTYNPCYTTSPNYAIQYLRRIWNGPTDLHPNWLGPYPECHRSPFASVFQLPFYVNESKASVEVYNFACTGGSIHSGLLEPQLSKNATVSQMQQLIDSWSAISWSENDIPVVVLSFGADDGQPTPLEEIAGVVKQAYEQYIAQILVDTAIYQVSLDVGVSLQNVLDTVQQLNLSSSSSSTGTRVFTSTEYIKAIGYLKGNISAAIHKTPCIIVQTYYSPLNPTNENSLLQCPDMAGLVDNSSKIVEIKRLLEELNSKVLAAAAHSSVYVNDIRGLMKHHEYCSGHEEWAYGPTVSLEQDIETFFSQVPILASLGPVAPQGNYGVSAFHPVPAAQSKIAEYLWHTIEKDIL